MSSDLSMHERKNTCKKKDGEDRFKIEVGGDHSIFSRQSMIPFGGTASQPHLLDLVHCFSYLEE